MAVVGLGLMGGSLLRALAASGREAVAWGPDPRERAAVAGLPGVRVPERLAEGLEGLEGVVLAAPLSAVGGLLEEIAGGPRPSWVTDVASLQGPPLAAARQWGLADLHVSSHPMVGGHQSGFGASRAELYRDAPVWLSSPEETAVREAVAGFWHDLGARPAWIDAGEHDRRMAWASHLPQVVSTHLAALLAEAHVPRGGLGPGGRDVTRLAGSDPTMWRDILGAASGPLPGALRRLAAGLTQEADRLARGDAEGFSTMLEATRRWSHE